MQVITMEVNSLLKQTDSRSSNATFTASFYYLQFIILPKKLTNNKTLVRAMRI